MRTFDKKVLTACALVLTLLTVKAQVATLYTFSQYTTPYTAIIGGSVYSTAALDDEDILGHSVTPAIPAATGPGLDMGFNFLYNNYMYDRFSVSNNGYISLGNSANGNTAINTNISDWNRPISSTSAASATQQCKIAAFGTDLLGKSTSNIRCQLLGTAPQRIMVIQWSDYQRFNAAPTGSDNINFQIRLYETSWIIEAVYGVVNSVTEDSVAQVGLRGQSNADFNNRVVINNTLTPWSASSAGTTNTANCRYNATVYPPSGTVYRWAMPQCSGLFSAVSTTAIPGVCPGATFSAGLAPTFTVYGIAYNWMNSNSSASGPYTVMPNSTLTVQNPLSITAPTWYQVEALCIHNGATVTSAPFNVTVAVPPTIGAVASTTNLCSGTSLTLNVTGNSVSHSWIGGYTSGVGFPAATAGNYTVIGTSAESCTASATVSVNVIQTPTQSIQNNPFYLCLGSTGTLTAPGATSYTWSSATQTVFTTSMTITPTSTGVSTYSVTKANSVCSDFKTISIVTYSLPSIFAFVQPTLVCALNPASISIGGGQTYTWTSPGNPPTVPSFTFPGSNPVVYPPVPTTYTAAATDGTCVNVTTVFVAVDPNPTITTSASTPSICNGQTVSLSATGGNNYTWTSTSSATTTVAQSFTDAPGMPTSYNVTGDNSFGCTSMASQIVIVHPNPTLTAIPNKTLVCSGGPSTITANGADTYLWTHNSAPTKTALANPVNTITGPVIFTVTGTYSATGCNSSKTVAVSVFVPTITITGNPNTCFGGMVNLTALAGPGNSNNYKWYTTIGGPSYNFATLSTSVAAATVFTVTAMTTSLVVNCPSSQTVDIGIYYNPTITAVAQRTTICVKEAVVLTATGGVTYVWSSNSQQTQTISVSPNSTASYTVTGTDANGCVNTGTVSVKVSGCVGINEFSNTNIGLVIYPNPNNGEFVVRSNSDISLTLINELGQIVRTVMVTESNNHTVSVSDLAKGIYFMTGQKDGAQIHQKIVVVK